MSTSAGTKLVGKLHGKFVHGRRVATLARQLAERIPPNLRVLDIGCGDGSIAGLIAELRPDISISGVEVLPRPGCKVACEPFDGENLPFPENSFDLCMMVDVLHHTPDVRVLLKEACRVSKSYVLLKDHLDENFLDHATLRVMDWVGNRPHGVRLTYNYQSQELWERHFAECGLKKESWSTDVSLYPAPVSWVAGRKLHFISLLKKESSPGPG